MRKARRLNAFQTRTVEDLLDAMLVMQPKTQNLGYITLNRAVRAASNAAIFEDRQESRYHNAVVLGALECSRDGR